MSQIAIKGATTGTGVFTIESPSSNTSRTLVLPDEAGTIDTLQRAGNVLQVVQATYSVGTAIASTSYVDTGLTASITPTSASSKILVLVAQTGHVYSNQTTNRIVTMNIVRHSTQVFETVQGLANRGGLSAAGDISVSASVFLSYLDSPNTTSSVAYKTQAKLNYITGSNYTAQVSDSTSVITLMEIAA